MSTNQRETAVVWEKATGKPVYNAIVWQDTRTDVIINELAKDGGQDRFREKVGLPLATYFSGPKIKWILANVPGAAEKADKGELLFGNIDTWVIWNLTGGPNGGVHVTDVTNASRTMMMNLATPGLGTRVCSKCWVYRARCCRRSNPPAQSMANAQTAAWMAFLLQAILAISKQPSSARHAMMLAKPRTPTVPAALLLMNTGTKPIQSKNGLLTTLGYKIGDEPAVYALEGSIAITGALVQWIRDNLKMIKKSPEIEDLAKTVDDSGGIYFVPAFSGLFAPYWKSDARGAIVGLTRYINAGHLARAVLEATAYQTREVLDAMNKDSGVELKALKVDGGMVFNELLMQFQSDILGVPVIRPTVAETTALGAAYAAGLAVGFWGKVDDLRANWGKDKEWEPKMDVANREKIYKGWKKAVTRTFDWVE